MVTRYGYHSDRTYWVWVKGRKFETPETVTAPNKVSALIKFASRRNVKSFHCDGVWLKPGSPSAYAYVVARREAECR